MTQSHPKVIKRYLNRKLYDTSDSCYVTLEDISEMIKMGEEVEIIDNTTKEDLTAVTLAQIIFEEQKKKTNVLPLKTFQDIIRGGSEAIKEIVTRGAKEIGSVREFVDGKVMPAMNNLNAMPAVREHMEITRYSLNRIYRLDPSHFEPIINVLVQRVASAEGSPRFQIESQGQTAAMAGTNWRSPAFAEVFVYVHPSGRGRGWGKSVVSACTAALLEERLRPLYMVDEGNQASIQIAEGLGYVDSGLLESVSEGQLKQL